MELAHSIDQRRSYREFETRSVEREKLELMIQAAQKAPVSCNLQLTQYIIIDDSEQLRYLGKNVSSKFIYAPVVIIALYDPRFTVERASVVTALGMAVENMLLTATDLGLGTCAMAGFGKDPIIKEKLAIPPELEIGLIVAVGYPKAGVYKAAITKVPLEKTFSYNTYGQLPRLNGSKRLSDHTPASIREYRSRIGSVYLDRLRLNTWSDVNYEQAAVYFKTQVQVSSSVETVLLDVMTYDAKFISQVVKEFPGKVITTDYVPEHLEVYRQLFSCQTTLIDDDNTIKNLSDASVDIATCVYQSSFTPEFPRLLSDIRRVLKPGGTLFLVHGKERLAKVWMRSLRQTIQNLIGQGTANIYEKNSYFKLGPYQHVSFSAIKHQLHAAGFKVRTSTEYTHAGLMSLILMAEVETDAVAPAKSQG